MSVSSIMRLVTEIPKARFCLWAAAVIGLVMPQLTTTVHAQDVPNDSGIISARGLEFSGEDNTVTHPNAGPGWLFRVGHYTGPTVGRTESITPFELMPYWINGNHILFSDFRLFRANGGDLRMGGNAGVGYKFFIEEWNRTLGAAFYYDRDDLSDVTFEEVSVALETLGENYDLRSNIYIPVGEKDRLSGIRLLADTARFQNYNVLFDQRRTIAKALTGFDAEIVLPLPTRFLRDHDVKVGAGGYFFEADAIPDVVGWKGRVEGRVFDTVNMRVELTSDDTFDTNVVFGVDWTYGGMKKPDTPRRHVRQHYRLTDPVRRNYQVSVAQVPVIDEGIVAVNPATGLPYRFIHIANNPPAAVQTGTVDEPFETIAMARALAAVDPTDFFFLHADSVFDTAPENALVLADGEKFLGEGDGVNHLIPVPGFGTPLPLPRATDGSNRPLFLDASGFGVTLARNSEFSGFEIRNSTDHSIFAGAGVNNAVVQNVFVTRDAGAPGTGDGIRLEGVTGRVAFANVEVQNAPGDGFHVVGGSPQVTFTTLFGQPGSGQIINNSNRAVHIENMAGGFVNMSGSFVTDNGGEGVLITNSAGQATIDNLTSNNSTTTGIQVVESSGVFSFRNTQNSATVIDNASGISVDLIGNSGTTVFQDLSITNRNDIGINIGASGATRFTGQARFTGDVGVGGVGGVTEGIRFRDATGTARFERSLSVSNSGGDGIVIGDAAGSVAPFNTLGSFNVGGQTAIDNAAGTSILVANTSTNVAFGSNGAILPRTLNITNRNGAGIVVNNVLPTLDPNGNPILDGQGNQATAVLSFNDVSISNANGVNLPAIDIQNSSTRTSFGTTNILNATGAGAPDAAVNVSNNFNDPAFPNLDGGQVSFGTLNITSTDAIGLRAVNNINADGDRMLLSIGGGTIASTNESAVDLQFTGTNVALDSVSATNAATGINLQNLTNPEDVPYNFRVLGDGSGTANGTGGTITGSTGQGVLVEDAGNVLLRAMVFNGNRTHVESLTTALNPNDGQLVEISLVQASASTEEGFDFLDTQEIRILDSIITNNGAAGFGSIRMQVATVDEYDWLIQNNTINDGTGVPIEVGPVVIANSTLTLDILENVITNTGVDDDAIRILWNGDLTTTIFNNAFTHTAGGAADFIEITTTSIDDDELADILIDTNSITAAGVGVTGINIDTAANSEITINNNLMTFNTGLDPVGADFNTGMSLTLGADSDVVITNNAILDTSEGDGIIFTNVVSPADIRIDGNQIDITGLFGGLQERGIVFLAVTGSVNLFGDVDNTVIIRNLGGPAIFFAMPPGSNNGQILVNGVSVP